MRRTRPLLKYTVPAGVLLAAAGLSLVLSPPRARTRLAWPVMNTIGAVVCRGGTPAVHDPVRTRTQEVWSRLDARLSAWHADSELSRLAPQLAAAGAGALGDVPADVRPCYAFAFDLARQSHGAFNPVVGEALARAGFARRAAVDLGAVAKGFAVDAACAALADNPPAKGCDVLLDLGGNLRAVSGVWRTGVRNPFCADAPLAAVDLQPGEAVATSGNYERFVVRNGRRVAPILDARTGTPVTGLAGVTVLAATALLADGLSTTLFILGPEEGSAFLAHHYPGTAALWLPDTPEAPVLIATISMAARLRETTCPVRIARAP